MTSAADALAAALTQRKGASITKARQAFWSARLAVLEAEHRGKASGIAIARAIADTADAIVLDSYREALTAHSGGSHVLVALGGYGRREMSPHSDVDLLFLFDREKDKIPSFIAGVLHPLWDLGFDLGHSSRTISESVKMARQDLESCTAMMDCRFLAGDEALFQKFHKRLSRSVPKGTVKKLQTLRQDRTGGSGSVHLLEPNVKDSPGALREIHLLEWALKARAGRDDFDFAMGEYLERGEVLALERGRDFFWRVRHELHFTAGRKHDRLEHEAQPTIAGNLGYADRPVSADSADTDDSNDDRQGPLASQQNRVGLADRVGADRGLELAVEQFMQQYYLHARAIYHSVELGFKYLTLSSRRRGRRILIEEGVVAVDGEILLPHGEPYFEEDRLRLLRIFSLARAKRLQLSEQAQRSVRQSLDLIDDGMRRNPEARDIFMSILRRRRRVADTLRAMHELGVLGAYIPEFGALTCLVQFDVYHLYTVDEHTLVALENLTSLREASTGGALATAYDELERQDLLILGILLHDIGKSKREEHISLGVELAQQTLSRLDLPDDDARFVLFLVKNHQEMVIRSQNRDLDDYGMIANFASLFATADWLRALYLMSYADLRAVAEGAWTDWHGALLLELYHKTNEQLQSGLKTLEERQTARQLLEKHLREMNGSPPLQVAAFEEHVEQLSARYLVAHERAEIGRHMSLIERAAYTAVAVDFVEHDDHTRLIVCTRDQEQLLAKICGVLAVNDVDILRADVNTRSDDVVLDIFQVANVDGSPCLPDSKRKRIADMLDQVITGERRVEQLFESYSIHWSRRRRHMPVRAPRIAFENQVSDRYTVIDTKVNDDAGLLFKITSVLGGMGLDIHMAIINTVANLATDSFYVSDHKGQKIVNYELLEGIRDRLLDELSAETPGGAA